jgi:hypothetical protein
MRPPRIGLLRLTAVLFLAAAAVARGADLGRLFLSPEERQRLQALREAPAAVPSTTAPPAAVTSPAPVTVNGIVMRRGGPPTFWVNGMNNYDGDLSRVPADVRLLDAGRVAVRVEGKEQVIELKPGQSYDPDSDRAGDRYPIESRP